MVLIVTSGDGELPHPLGLEAEERGAGPNGIPDGREEAAQEGGD